MENQQRPRKEPLPEIVDKKCRKKLQAQQEEKRLIFFGLGMIGVIGWTVAIPAVIGVFVGRWLDGRHLGEDNISWTLTCLFGGLLLGALVAWHWINKEGKAP